MFLLSRREMIDPLGREDVLRLIALEELVQRKLIVPTAKTTP